MEEISEFTDISNLGMKQGYTQFDGKYEKIFTDEGLLEKINQCEHPTALINETKDAILEIEKIFLPLKSRASSIMIETKGGSVVAQMTLEVFFDLLDIGKRIEILDRFLIVNLLSKKPQNHLKTKY